MSEGAGQRRGEPEAQGGEKGDLHQGKWRSCLVGWESVVMMMMMMEGTGFSTIDSENVGQPDETKTPVASITQLPFWVDLIVQAFNIYMRIE